MSDDKKPNKITVYLTEDAQEMFKDLYIERIRKDFKFDKSSLICEAIALLHQKEFS
jgi:hypothetical protein